MQKKWKAPGPVCVSLFSLKTKAADASVIPCPLHRNFIVPAVNAESTRPDTEQQFDKDRHRPVWNALRPSPEALSCSLHGCSCATNGFVMVRCILQLELARCSCFRNILFHPIEVLSLSLQCPTRVYILLVSVFPLFSPLFPVFFFFSFFFFASNGTRISVSLSPGLLF